MAIRPIDDLPEELGERVNTAIHALITDITGALYGAPATLQDAAELPVDAQRDHHLAVLAAAEMLREQLYPVTSLAAYAAGGTTGITTTYADLGAAAGITRQAARERWPGAVLDTQPGRPRAPQSQEGGFVMVVYRNADPKIDESGRVFGETGTGEEDQIESDRKWWRIAPGKRRRLRGVVYVHEGVVARIRAVDPQGVWAEDARGYASIPVTAPLTDAEIGQQLPTLELLPGATLPQTQGPSRRYLPL